MAGGLSGCDCRHDASVHLRGSYRFGTRLCLFIARAAGGWLVFDGGHVLAAQVPEALVQLLFVIGRQSNTERIRIAAAASTPYRG